MKTIAIGIFVLAALTASYSFSFAQSSPDPTPTQCEQIKQAVAQYGLAAARRHALEHYGAEAVKVGDKCLTKKADRRTRAH